MKKEFIFIDYLRAIAALTVVVAHVYGMAIHNYYQNISNTIARMFYECFYTGGFAVCLFFLISGFIIPLSFTSLRAFFIRRIFRIYPAFLFVSAMAFYVLDIPFKNEHFFSLSLLFADFVNAPKILTGIEWTLRIEVLFYIVTAVLIWKNKLNVNSTITMAVLLLISNIITQGNWPDNRPLPLIYPYILLLGMNFYLLHSQQINRKSFIASNTVLLLIFMIVFQIFELAPYKQLTYPFTSLIVFYLCYQYQHKFRRNYIVDFFAKCSYVLYLTHNFMYKYILAQLSIFKSKLIMHSLTWMILITMCYVIHLFVEKPCIQMGVKLSKRFLKPAISKEPLAI